MKRILQASLFTILLIPFAHAGHIGGGEISYRYIGDSTSTPHHYEVTVILTRNPMSPIGLPNSFGVTVSSSCYSSQSLTVQQITSGTSGSASPSNTECFGPNTNIPVFQLYYYKGTVVLPGTCVDFKFAISPHCCRGNTDNISNSISLQITAEAFLNNTFFNNDLTLFTNDAAVGLCPGWEVEWPISFINPDGDSLFFSFAPITNAVYAAGYSYQEPIMTQQNTTFHLNPENAVITLTPSVSQFVTVLIQVREFKYHTPTSQWIEKGRGFKDFKVLVAQSCNINDLIVTLDLKTPVNCHDKVLEIEFDKDLRTNTIDEDGSDLVIFGPDNFLLAIDHIEKIHGLTQMRTEKIKVHLLDSVMLNGDYHVVTRIGNDLNTMISPCGYQLDPNDTVATFTIADASCGNISVDEIDLPQMKIYPNPVTDQLTVEPHNGRPYSVSVYDMQGRLLLHRENLTDTQSLNTTDLASGVYLVKIYRGKTLLISEKIYKTL